MKISIFGLGYVGAVSLACLARDGHEIVGVDIDPNKLELIRQGKSPIIEEGIQELTHRVVQSDRVRVTDDPIDGVQNSELSFICVGTPAMPNGRQDTTAILRLAEQLGTSIGKKPDWHLVVIRSTVQPGMVEEVIKPIIEEKSGKRAGIDFGLCFQPEFLREGSSIRDYDNPPYTIVGVDSSRSADQLESVFGQLPCEFIVTDIRTAEMVKYACNSFHALKATFANEIGRISQALSVNSHAVMDLVCKDKQLNISPAYMRPGFAFGGSCLPKDLKALMYLAKQEDVNLPMLSAVLPSNRVHIDHAIDTVLNSGKRDVGMIGLSFKSGTDDLRESPLVTIAERFIGKGINLRIYDPEVNVARLMGSNKQYIEESIPHIASLMCQNCEELVASSEVIVVGLSNSAILSSVVEHTRTDQMVLDLVNMPERKQLQGIYHGVCW